MKEIKKQLRNEQRIELVSDSSVGMSLGFELKTSASLLWNFPSITFVFAVRLLSKT